MARTDVHRPGAILPTDYTWVASFGTMYMAGEEPECYGYEDVPEGPFADIHEGLQACDVCGAHYNHGAVLLHNPTGIHITIGHDCASKYSLQLDLAGWKAWHAAARDKRAQAAIEMKNATRAREWKAANPAVVEAIEAALAATRNDHSCETHGRNFDYDSLCCRKAIKAEDLDRKNKAIMILADMARKLARYGSLSDAQAAFAVKLGETVRTWVPTIEKHVPAPTGRVTVCGRVVSVKDYESQYGTTWKMTVKVETPDGSWLTWTTVPTSIHDLYQDARTFDNGLAGWLKGRTVEFIATLERGKDDHFAFGKRPTKARIVEAQA